jgi:hypothetical protein
MSFDQEKMRKDFDKMRIVAKSMRIAIVNPSETGCMLLGFNTFEMGKVMGDIAVDTGSGMKAVQEISKLLCMEGAGTLDYRGEYMNSIIEDLGKYYFKELSEDDYARLCSDGYVYLNNYGYGKEERIRKCIEYGVGNGGCDEDYNDKEEYPNKYDDEMDWFWNSWY